MEPVRVPKKQRRTTSAPYTQAVEVEARAQTPATAPSVPASPPPLYTPTRNAAQRVTLKPLPPLVSKHTLNYQAWYAHLKKDSGNNLPSLDLCHRFLLTFMVLKSGAIDTVNAVRDIDFTNLEAKRVIDLVGPPIDVVRMGDVRKAFQTYFEFDMSNHMEPFAQLVAIVWNFASEVLKIIQAPAKPKSEQQPAPAPSITASHPTTPTTPSPVSTSASTSTTPQAPAVNRNVSVSATDKVSGSSKCVRVQYKGWGVKKIRTNAAEDEWTTSFEPDVDDDEDLDHVMTIRSVTFAAKRHTAELARAKALAFEFKYDKCLQVDTDQLEAVPDDWIGHGAADGTHESKSSESSSVQDTDEASEIATPAAARLRAFARRLRQATAGSWSPETINGSNKVQHQHQQYASTDMSTMQSLSDRGALSHLLLFSKIFS